MATAYKCSDLEARVIQVLGENLPGEMAYVDGQRGGEPTPEITAWLAGPRPSQHTFPAVQVDAKSWTALEDLGLSDGTDGRGQYQVEAEVSVHVQTTGEDTNRMRDIAQRFMAGIERVLLYRKDRLQTAADPIGFCVQVKRNGPATVVDPEQSSGAFVRSIRIPLAIHMVESLDV